MTSDEKQKAFEPVLQAAQDFYLKCHNITTPLNEKGGKDYDLDKALETGTMTQLLDSFKPETTLKYAIDFLAKRDAGLLGEEIIPS